MKSLSAGERTLLLRLASELPKGSEERRTLLSGLKTSGWEKGVLQPRELDFEFNPLRKEVRELFLKLHALIRENVDYLKIYEEAGPSKKHELEDAESTQRLLKMAWKRLDEISKIANLSF